MLDTKLYILDIVVFYNNYYDAVYRFNKFLFFHLIYNYYNDLVKKQIW